MSNTFPALAGTFLIQIDDTADAGYRLTPVIGWQATQGTRVAPLIAQAPIPLKHGTALVLPMWDGSEAMVSDPTHRATFDSIDEWVDFILNRADSSALPVGKSNAVGLNVVFDAEKSYSKTSWWHFRDGPNEFIFTLPKDSQVPDDPRIQKTNREAFALLKKTVNVVPVADLYVNYDEPAADLDAEAEDLV